MKKIFFLGFFFLALSNAFSQVSYWETGFYNSLHKSYKTAFVTTVDQINQFVVKNNKGGKIEFFIITDKQIYQINNTSVSFRFHNSGTSFYCAIEYVQEGIYQLYERPMEQHKIFQRGPGVIFVKSEEFISFLKSSNSFDLNISTYNDYSRKEYTIHFTCKESSKLLKWALSDEFN